MMTCKLYFLQPFLYHRILIGVPVPSNVNRELVVLGGGTEVEL